MYIIIQNDLETKEIYIVHSKTGIPCTWEEGGSMTNTGEAWIIGDSFGRAKKPIYVRNHGKLACSEHALIPVRKGDTLIHASRWHDEYTIVSYRIKEITGDSAVVHENEMINYEMLQAAIDKVSTYHCRIPMYIIQDDEKDLNISDSYEGPQLDEDDCYDDC